MNMQKSFKEQDREHILTYIKKEDGDVKVDDIITNSGAHKLRVYPILFELVQEKKLKVVKKEKMGAPMVVRMVV